MKGATANKIQLEKNKKNWHKSKEETAKATRENIYQTTKSWKGAGIISEESESRSHQLTRQTQNS